MLDKSSSLVFAKFVMALMADLPGIRSKAMFGGFGIYRKELMFALIADAQLYFKANDFLADEFIALGLPAFTFTSKTKQMRLHYYQAPEQVFEDPEQMLLWAEKAYQCALRNAMEKSQKSTRRKK
jgi:DNA transformation protein